MARIRKASYRDRRRAFTSPQRSFGTPRASIQMKRGRKCVALKILHLAGYILNYGSYIQAYLKP